MALHRNLSGTNIHVSHAYTYADATERLAAVLTADDIGKVCFQQDSSVFYVLIGYSPMAWAAMTGNIANPLTDEGDILYGGASGTPQRLPGVDGSYLRSQGNAGAPTFTRALDVDSLLAAPLGSSLHASAILQADSVTQGILMPRMTEAQRDAITTPAAGLVVYATDQRCPYVYDGFVWRKLQIAATQFVSVTTDETGDFLTIQDAIDSITGAADDNRYVVRVGPGTFTEDVTMGDYIQVSGQGWDTLILGQVICDGLGYTQLSNVRVFAVNKPALLCSSDEVNVTDCFLESAWDDAEDPGIVRCCVEASYGIVYLYKESEASLVVTDAVNTSASTIQTVYHLTGTDTVYLESYGSFEYIDTVNGGNTLCCLYSDNTDESTEGVLTLGVFELSMGGTHLNKATLLSCSGANSVLIAEYKSTRGVSAAGTPMFILADISNSPVMSAGRCAFGKVDLTGFADADVYYARATHATDRVGAQNYLFKRSTDSFPARNTTGGSAGSCKYNLATNFGSASSSGKFNDADHGAQITDWATVAEALGGEASAAGDIFVSDGLGSGAMLPTVPVTRVLTVGVGTGAQYSSIKTAIEAAITGGASATSPWRVDVYPGTYTEDPMVLAPGIVLTSLDSRSDTVFIVASDSLEDLFTCTGGYMTGMLLSGVAAAAKALIRCATASTLTVLHGISVRGCSTGIAVSNGASVVATSFSIHLTGPSQGITTAVQVLSGGAFHMSGGFVSAPAALLPYYSVNPIQTVFNCSGSSSVCFLTSCTLLLSYKTDDATGLLCDDGGDLSIFASQVSGAGIAAHIGSSGSASQIMIQGCSFSNNYLNGKCESSTGLFFVNASSTALQWDGVAGSVLSGIVQLRGQDRTYLVGEASYSDVEGHTVDLAHYLHDGLSTGVSVGGEVTPSSGLDVDVAAGRGWVVEHATHSSQDAEWEATSLTLTANSTCYVVYDSVAAAIAEKLTAPGLSSVLLAIVVTGASSLRFVHLARTVVHDNAKMLNDYLSDTRKVALKSGLGVVQGTTARNITVGSGSYYLMLDAVTYAGAADATFSAFYGTNGATEVASQTQLDITQYDSSGTLTNLTAGYFRADTVVLTSDGRVSVIYGTEEFATQVAAEAALVAAIPTFIEPSAFLLALVIVQQASGIVSVLDRRLQPATGGSGGGSAGVTVHAALTGLSADDHTQYLLAAGTRAMSGSLDMGGNAITDVGNVDGVDVSSHMDRHLPGGADALTLATPSVIVPGAASAGSAASFVRSDHQHGIGTGTPVAVGTANSAGSGTDVSLANHVHDHGSQTVATHHAAVTTSANGFMTAADKTKLDGVATGATNVTLSSTAPVNVTKATASAGAATQAARQDHKHDISTATAVGVPPGTANAEGVSASLARADHTHAVPAYGTVVSTICQGNDSRLSDDRTASGLRTATTVVSVSTATAPSAGQVLQASSSTSAAWATPATVVFGQDYQYAESLARSTTTSSVFQTKVTLTTPALTGTYRVAWTAGYGMDSTSNRRIAARLYNSTDAVELDIKSVRPSVTTVTESAGGFAQVTFTGSAKTFLVQFRALDGTSVAIENARLEFWRVA